jgi:hypothetical protein
MMLVYNVFFNHKIMLKIVLTALIYIPIKLEIIIVIMYKPKPNRLLK